MDQISKHCHCKWNTSAKNFPWIFSALVSRENIKRGALSTRNEKKFLLGFGSCSKEEKIGWLWRWFPNLTSRLMTWFSRRPSQDENNMFDCYYNSFHLSVVNSKPKQLLQPVKRDRNSVMSQSGLKAITAGSKRGKIPTCKSRLV